jgi:hypothetical protein
MECLESKILKTEMFEFWCVNIESWKLKIEICVKCFEPENLETKMSKLGCVNT